MSTKQNNQRYGFKWSVNEVLSLQREFELLGWGIDQIAQKHQRTPNAIMYKLDQEGFADYNALYSKYHNLETSSNTEIKTELNLESFHNDNDSDSDYEDENENEDDDDEDFVDEEECDDDDDEEEDNDDELANLSERMDNLEESISEIKHMIKQLITKQHASNTWF
jgi:hypothetical protein